MKLSIAIITWNRSEQLKEAVESCFKCDIPKDTQFVIIDNASTDNTETVVNSLFDGMPYDIYYEKMAENLGVGRGRNYAFSKAKGEYVYFLDDDAYVDLTKGTDFFKKGIEILDSNSSFCTLTTQIYDLLLKINRVDKGGPYIGHHLYQCFMICGGSHFLRRSFWLERDPYFPNKYGYEELQPSIRVADAGKLNVFCDDMLVIHNPLINKWSDKKNASTAVIVKEVANQFAIKSSIYPVIAYPLVLLAYRMRSIKYLNKSMRKEACNIVHQMKTDYDFGERIKLSTFVSLLYDFGITIL